ncbi:glucose-methanol-choline oxidoreductase [Pseudanabaena sp. lw0831]|uniref:GMC family oxidoreductase n=1 Tax=Pseudanabaena sp. lw0831 TaxID=1357935 RepID=UPI001915267A|nr:GMC family oxidoreductase [Pseudanabaena sp. lw0831]GBO55412.1 glucose-methanol-choline oxidoreductase [Pseudanabaena sp. lw0831]
MSTDNLSTEHLAAEHYDIIIIGTGAAGGTLAYKLASTGKSILVLERGGFMPREKENWDTKVAFKSNRYHNDEVWYDRDGNELHPGMSYSVGGNTKIYGAALFRLRERDFESYQHKDGISPAWPLKYRDFEPYYTEAEKLYQVHGNQGLDPTEPPRSHDYFYPAVSHEPRMESVSNSLQQKGLHPYHTPLGIRLNEVQQHLSECIRCNTCDGFPCLVHAKSDAEVTGILPAIQHPNLTLLTEAKVLKLHTSDSGKEITTVEVSINNEIKYFSGGIVVLSCGAVNSSTIMLRSHNDQHPNGLANSSDLVGRNFMKHVLGSVIGVTKEPNPTKFQKTLSINDFYWGEDGYDYPMGQIQTLGKVNKEMIEGNAAAYAPRTPEEVASHSVDWWLTVEDLPDHNNRVRVDGDRIILDYTENNSEPYARLEQKWIEILKSIDCGESILSHDSYFVKGSTNYFTGKLPLQGVGHQVGTCRFGEDPQTSVLNLNCQTHDIDNLYVVDGSFFCSSGAVNPTLTIIANALRVAEHLIKRLEA